MDALIYTVMSGAERVQRAQQVHANNLANLDTPGFRANFAVSGDAQVKGYGYDARHQNRLEADAVSGREGSQRDTGRDLDVAIAGPGLFAVQYGDGEAYTRAGNFTLDADGALLLGRQPVLGDGGPIVLPPHSKLQIAADGLISILAPGQTELQQVDRLKLVSAPAAALTKNEAGLLVARDGQALTPDEQVQVQSGRIEGSNVAAVEEMVHTMTLSRDFEVQMRLFKAADGMAEAGNRLVRE
jgi:flagellar basal-body rod protein FlgF